MWFEASPDRSSVHINTVMGRAKDRQQCSQKKHAHGTSLPKVCHKIAAAVPTQAKRMKLPETMTSHLCRALRLKLALGWRVSSRRAC